ERVERHAGLGPDAGLAAAALGVHVARDVAAHGVEDALRARAEVDGREVALVVAAVTVVAARAEGEPVDAADRRDRDRRAVLLDARLEGAELGPTTRLHLAAVADVELVDAAVDADAVDEVARRIDRGRRHRDVRPGDRPVPDLRARVGIEREDVA